MSLKAEIQKHFGNDYSTFYKQFLEGLQPGGTDNLKTLCCFHEDNNPSLSVNIKDGRFNCKACGAKGDAFSFYAKKHGLDVKSAFPEVLRGIAEAFGIEGANGSGRPAARRLVKTYDYTDAAGNVLFRKNRFEPKSFSLCRPDGAGGWRNDLAGVDPVLYQLPEVLAADEVWVAEGEKDCDSLAALGITATTNFDGAGKWRESYAQVLAGKRCIIIPDADGPGRNHAQLVARSLAGKAAWVGILDLPAEVNGRPIKDAADFIQAVGDPAAAAEQLGILAEQVVEYTPTAEQESLPDPEGAAAVQVVNVADEWLDVEPPPTDPVFEGFVDMRQRVAVIGGTKRRKSFVVAVLAILSAVGREGIGLKAVKPRKTLLVQFEIEAPYMWRRVQRLCRPMQICREDIAGRLFILNLRDQLDDENFDKIALDLIEKAMHQTGAEVLIIDPIYVLNSGEENETMSMRRLLRRFGTINRTMNAALIYSMHDKKSGHYDQELSNRGSGTGLTARDYDGAMFLSPHESGDDDLTVVEFLVRHAPPRKPYCIRWEWDENSHYFTLTDDLPDKAVKATKCKRETGDFIEKARSIITEYKAQVEKNLPPGSPPPMMPKRVFQEKMSKHMTDRAFWSFCTEHIYDEEDGTGGPDSPIRAYKDKTRKNKKFLDNSLTWRWSCK